ncbi:MAG: primosomal protein N' [Spirochaetes bacterium]|nr:primosomal protein N' [Spirochaetota bacterium]
MYADVFIGYPLDERFTYRIPEGSAVAPGMRVMVDFRRRTLMAYVERVHDTEPQGFQVKDIISAIDPEPIFDARLLELARFVAGTYLGTVGEALAMALPSGKSEPKRIRPINAATPSQGPRLNDEQEGVYRAILASLAEGRRRHLIFGVTGSGKTEIYIKLAMHFIAQGKSVLYLVPEISISSQIYDRLHRVFGDDLVLYHSNLSQGERLRSWNRFYRGEATIAVGTRSAVFLQCPDLGMIAIDEEHDGSYKEHSSPRYNARRLAFRRSADEGALLVLGSATPSMESFTAAERGVIGIHLLQRRYGGARLPEIEVLEIEGGRPEDIITPRLKLYTKQAVERGEQAIYLLNRRGFSPVIRCGACGHVVTCPHCDISLNGHSGGMMECHYCGFRRREPECCDSCGEKTLARLGAGTQRIEEIIASQFRGMRVFRMDQDSMRRKGEADRMMGMMRRGEIDILLGTQMVAKGFDFPRVTLVGVLMADIGLNIPDFRATEKIFSLLMQVAGRSGRGEQPGRVVVQTLSGDNPLFNFFRRHDYDGFYRHEKRLREDLGYPPFTRMARLLLRGTDEGRVAGAAAEVRRALDAAVSALKSGVRVLGPTSAPLVKIGGNYRHHLLLKSESVDELRRVIEAARETARLGGVYLEIDIDPVEIM